jgi:hypothetical protein
MTEDRRQEGRIQFALSPVPFPDSCVQGEAKVQVIPHCEFYRPCIGNKQEVGRDESPFGNCF